MKKEKFDIFGMSCSACSSRIQKNISKLDGVISCNVNLLTNSMDLEYDETIISDINVIDKIKGIGYDAKVHDDISNMNKTKSNITLYKLILSIILVIPIMFLSMRDMIGIKCNNNLATIIIIILTSIIIIINYKYFVSGFKGLIHKAPNMDTLVSLGATVSFVYSLCLFLINKQTNNLFFESASMILTFVSIGKYIESLSKSKTTDAISKLVDLSPSQTLIEENGLEKLINTDDVKKGDIVILKDGYRVSVDGEVIKGFGFCDESSLTGEPIPVEKEVDSFIYCGTTLTSGYVKVKALEVKNDTKLAKIINLVEEASNSKAPISKLADKVSLIFVPAVILISIIVLLIWMLTGNDINLAVNFALSVLVISCPCALGLATPTAIMVGTGKAANLGILFKNSESLELLSKTKNIVFDKTGTITEGKAKVVDIITNDFDEDKLIKIVSSIESMSNHPLASAIIDFYNKDYMFTVSDFKSYQSKGISGIIDSKTYYIGKEEFISSIINNNSYAELKDKSLTPIYVSDENNYLGVILIRDEIKESSIKAIKKLDELNIDTYMLTGDNVDTAKYVQAKTGIKNIKANLMPDDKEKYIKLLTGIGTTVMVGDGINDSLALVSSDIGIAIGAGADIAIDSANIILSKNDLNDVVTAISLSKKVVKIIKENLFWAFIYNVICIPLAAGALFLPLGIKLTPIIGSIAMCISSICVVLNSLRIRSFKIKDERTNKMKKVYIDGMMCEHCKKNVENTLLSLSSMVEVNLDGKYALVDDSVNNDEIISKITEAGYKVINIE